MMLFALSVYLACVCVIFGLSVAVMGWQPTLWAFAGLHVGGALVILVLYEWEVFRRRRSAPGRKAPHSPPVSTEKLPGYEIWHRPRHSW